MFEDEKYFGKSLFRSFTYLGITPDNTTIPEDVNGDLFDCYYASNTLYFLNSKEKINMGIEIFDFTRTDDVENKLAINSKKTINVVIEGLGIPANFTKEIKLDPTIHPFKESAIFTGGNYGARYGENPVNTIPSSSYQVERVNLGISEWDIDSDESFDAQYANGNYRRSWLNRLHGDIIDMAFFIETNE
jgi:hypothetical protein